jgi:hypothetical protein
MNDFRHQNARQLHQGIIHFNLVRSEINFLLGSGIRRLDLAAQQGIEILITLNSGDRF